MKNIEYLFNQIKESNITLIGYTHEFENVKDELISKLPCIKLGRIGSSFSISSYLRDAKLDNILEDYNNNFKYVTFDVNEIDIPENFDISLTKSRLISKIVDSIRDDIYNIGGYNLVITAPMYRSYNSVNNFTGGNKPLYMCDLSFKIESNVIKIIKNRISSDDTTVSLDGLKDYNYICNYETSNK